ncbi:MAG TPA: dTDP-4-dehydrorhamnose reductase [Rhizomicrobium sp.]|jgi:dTDP-4-dehydrorhamnose reductase|nr:dTDP-4-dehydrorhamnose reductase [Rhizomicrobium sp.]
MAVDGKPLSILQFGKTGQVARALTHAAAARSDISIQALGRTEADLQRPDDIARAIRDAGPIDVVVNAAAYTAVDKAEAEPDIARVVNEDSVAAMAQACRARDVPLIHISTDYVFDGTKPSPYVEDDATNPLGVYGRTKLAGENAIRAMWDRHVILRASWVYSPWGTNFVKTMLRLGAERDELRVVDDQHGAPTSAIDIAEAILSIAPRIARSADPSLFGTFHFCDAGETTWRRFAEAIFADSVGWKDVKAKVVSITTAEYTTAAQRPQNSRLDCTKIERAHAVVRNPWRQSLKGVLSEIKNAV